MRSRAIVSCAYSEGQNGRYLPYAQRLEKSLTQYWRGERNWKIWTESFPPGSPTHRECHYAFKYHAVAWGAEQGFTKVMWLDAGVEAISDIEPVWQEIERRGVYVVAGGEPLGEWISDQALAHFGVTRDRAMDLRLCGGAVVGLDFGKANARAFFKKWGELAQTNLFISAHSKHAPDRMRSLWVSDHDENMIVSSDPRFKGHRSDEACFSLMLHELGISTVSLGKWNECMKSGY